MKILTAMYTMRRGGAYDRFMVMVEALLERGWEVHCLSLTPIQIGRPFFHNHIMHFPFKKVDGLMAKLMVIFIFPLWAVWVGWRKRIDLIIAFGSLYAFIQALSKIALRRPMVTLIRGNSTFSLKMQGVGKYFQSLDNTIKNIGLIFSDRIITNNIADRNEILKKLGKKKIDVQILYNNIPTMNIRNPEDIFKTRKKYGIPDNAKILVTAGIINRGKNIDTLIECIPKMEVNNLYLLIAGDSATKTDYQYKNSLQELSKKLKVEKRVIFTGWLEKEELWNIYLASDLFVLPSLSEGMPNAMLEALGLNLPCFGSNIPGIMDILRHEELLFDLFDEKELTQKIVFFLSDKVISDHIASLCQERKKNLSFDWKEKAYELITKRTSDQIDSHLLEDKGPKDV